MLLLDATLEIRQNMSGVPGILDVIVPGLGMVHMCLHSSDNISTFHNSSPVGERTKFEEGDFDDSGNWHSYGVVGIGFNLTWRHINGRFELSPHIRQSLPKITDANGCWGNKPHGHERIVDLIAWALSKVFSKL